MKRNIKHEREERERARGIEDALTYLECSNEELPASSIMGFRFAIDSLDKSVFWDLPKRHRQARGRMLLADDTYARYSIISGKFVERNVLRFWNEEAAHSRAGMTITRYQIFQDGRVSRLPYRFWLPYDSDQWTTNFSVATQMRRIYSGNRQWQDRESRDVRAEVAVLPNLVTAAINVVHSSWNVFFTAGTKWLGFPTDPTGVKELFTTRAKESTRRAALLHWVRHHYRQKRTDATALVEVREHLRGRTTFLWNGLQCQVRPSDADAVLSKREELLVEYD